MKNKYWYITGGIILAYFLFGVQKAFGKITSTNEFRNCDAFGCGSFGASRDGGTRTHKGIDIVTSTNEVIFAPISGKVTKHSAPYPNDSRYKGIEITNEMYKVKIFYLLPLVPIGTTVKQGQKIGTAQNLNLKYNGITNHVHLEVYDNLGKLINPKNLY